MIAHINAVVIEMVVVDLVFASFYNLVSDYRDTNQVAHYSGKMMSGIFISLILLLYMKTAEKSIYTPQKMLPFESGMITENLYLPAAKNSINVRMINMIFKIKIVFLMACIIML